MSLCAQCGLVLVGDGELCAHHACVHGDNWSDSNRVMCAFVHRGIVASRLPAKDREDEYIVNMENADA